MGVCTDIVKGSIIKGNIRKEGRGIKGLLFPNLIHPNGTLEGANSLLQHISHVIKTDDQTCTSLTRKPSKLYDSAEHLSPNPPPTRPHRPKTLHLIPAAPLRSLPTPRHHLPSKPEENRPLPTATQTTNPSPVLHQCHPIRIEFHPPPSSTPSLPPNSSPPLPTFRNRLLPSRAQISHQQSTSTTFSLVNRVSTSGIPTGMKDLSYRLLSNLKSSHEPHHVLPPSHLYPYHPLHRPRPPLLFSHPVLSSIPPPLHSFPSSPSAPLRSLPKNPLPSPNPYPSIRPLAHPPRLPSPRPSPFLLPLRPPRPPPLPILTHTHPPNLTPPPP